jgi:hypothetical protein
VGLHRAARDVQPFADLRVGEPLDDQVHHLALGAGQTLPAELRPPARAAAASKPGDGIPPGPLRSDQPAAAAVGAGQATCSS